MKKSMTDIEVLAPAGSFESMEAAVRAGADAVYMGGAKFGARAYACLLYTSNTKPYLEKIGVPCPKCGADLVIRKTKKGRRYYGCEKNPECDYMTWQKPSTDKSDKK